MTQDHLSDAEIAALFKHVRHIAVMGYSANEARPAHYVAQFLKNQGYQITGVNPGLAGQTVGGIPVVGTLAEVSPKPDMVDVFRQADAIPGIVADVKAQGITAMWLQLGIIHDEAIAEAKASGITTVVNRCPKIEIPRLGLLK